MTDAGVIDRFFEVFSRYIDSGFGLLGGEVAFLATTLIVIDVTLAALFWAWGPSDDILARLVKKTLFVGFFAFLIGNFQRLSEIVFASFAGLGLKASGAGMSTADFMRPGRLAQSGIDAGRPMLEAAADMSGFPGFFENFVQIAILMIAFIVVLIAFFVLAIQLFVTLIEFKLTSLAGFVLIPFGLFGKTAFLAERVLGNVVASGVKVLVLAVIVGIGSTLFDTFVRDFGGEPPTLEDVLAITLAALTLAGLAIFGPGIATGLVSGAPQLGAGAAVGAGLAVGGVAMAGAAGMRMAAGAGAGLAGRAGTATAAGRSASAAGSGGGPPGGGAGGAARGGSGGGGRSGPRGGPGGDPGGGSNARSSVSSTEAAPQGGPGPRRDPGPSGPDAPGAEAASPSAGVPDAAGSKFPAQAAPSQAPSRSDGPPKWARDMARRQAVTQGVSISAHALRSGDKGGGSASISLSEDRS